MASIKEDFFREYEIERMNKNSLTIVNRCTYEHLFVSRNAFNAIMTNKAELVIQKEVQMPDGRITKWLAIVTTIIF
jgi:hypothetical protein